jgi:hypothetical protein
VLGLSSDGQIKPGQLQEVIGCIEQLAQMDQHASRDGTGNEKLDCARKRRRQDNVAPTN